MSHNDSRSKKVKNNRKKRLVFKLFLLILVLLSVVIIYSLFEFLTRVIIENERKSLVLSIWQEDDLIAQSLRPNEKAVHRNSAGEFSVNVETTSQGLRDTKVYQIPKPANTFRILMLGDSFTFGHGVEIDQTFSKVLEKALNDEHRGGPGVNFEVINAGYACGFTWDEYYLCLKERGLVYQPDLVVINTWVGNDLTDLLDHEYPTLDEKSLPVKITSKTNFVNENNFLQIAPQPVIEIRPGIRGVKDRINVLCYKSILCQTAIWPIINGKITNMTQQSAAPTSTSPTSNGLPSYWRFLNFLIPNLTRDIGTAWETGKKMLLAAEKISDDANAEFMIVNIPVKFEVYDPDGFIKTTKINGVNLIIDNKRIETFAKEHSISYCSPLALLKQRPDVSYFAFDSHLTVLGHQLVAQAIEDCLSPSP